MPRYRLRYQASNIEMPMGDFLIGRSSSCNLSVDDASVSRRHALLRVAADGVTIEDLGSRNGVRVNGDKVEGQRRLQHMDELKIGNQEMLFIDSDQGRRKQQATTEMRRCDGCGALQSTTAETCDVCGNALPRARQSIESQTIELHLDQMSGQQAQAFELISGIADKALAMKSYEKAEQMLQPHLDLILLGLQQGKPPESAQRDKAVGFALRLAEGKNGARWITWIFATYAASRRLMDEKSIEKLHDLVRRARYTDAEAIRSYLDALSNIEGTFTPGDRFLVRRLEALLRVVAA